MLATLRQWKKALGRHESLTYLAGRARTLLRGPGWSAFQGDPIYQGLVETLIDITQPSSFVETGTYHGYTAEYVARAHPGLTVFTTEIDRARYWLARVALSRYPNVTVLRGSSDVHVGELLDSGQLGDRPLFFLDAHWRQHWPLRGELEHIAASGVAAVIVIDDFAVPGEPQFGFDLAGGSGMGGAPCDLDYISPVLSVDCDYRALVPRYDLTERRRAFGPTMDRKPLRGHIALFQNSSVWADRATEQPHIERYYRDLGRLPDEPAPREPA